MRIALLVLSLITCVGCGSSGTPLPTPVTVNGKLEMSDGKPIGGLQLTLFPLEGQHPAYIPVAEDGTFKVETISGKYSYSVGKSSAKNSEATLKKVNPKFYEADLTRSVVVQSGQELKVTLE
jgi:hypothetical protein